MGSFESLSQDLAKISLEIGAIQLNPEDPFTWASGYRMPVYNDNRLLLGNAEHRRLVAEGFQTLIRDHHIEVDVVAGTATAGIAPATTLANLLEIPLVYVRPSPKQHGMRNQVEGILKENQTVVVIEDLVSTGKSAVNAVEAIRKSGARVEHCLCIFNYGFEKTLELFRETRCQLHSLLTFESLLKFAEESKTLSPEQIEILHPWHKDPFQWGRRHGFPKQE